MQRLFARAFWADKGPPLLYVLVGFAVAYVSSQPVLDPQSSFWQNDEGRYLLDAKSNQIILSMRYSLFVVLVKAYLLVFDDFWTVLIHKAICAALLVGMFYRRILATFGPWKFGAIYVIFLYLNLSFLRDPLIYIASLAAFLAIHEAQNMAGNKRLAGLGVLTLLRPNILLLHMKPVITLTATAIFLFFFRSHYAEAELGDSVMTEHFWEQILHGMLVSANGINPLTKISWYIGHERLGEYILLLPASLVLILALTQMMLAAVRKEYRFIGYDRAMVGLVANLVLYAALGIAADIRIFLSAFGPLALFVGDKLKSARTFAILFATLCFLTLVKGMVGSW